MQIIGVLPALFCVGAAIGQTEWQFRPSGIEWMQRDSHPTFDFTAVTYGAGTWLAVGNGGGVVTSEAPKAPLELPQLNPRRSITLSWPTAHGRWYQPEASTDGITWSAAGLAVYGDGEGKYWTDRSDFGEAMFYRVSVR
ncbi:MAG: hypothetical protein ACR2OZ_08985 [Verrucomicrobiales bacterium]